jgi:hypothetical protein
MDPKFYKDTLIASAKDFRKRQLGKDTVLRHQDSQITDNIVHEVLYRYVDMVNKDLTNIEQEVVQQKLLDFIPLALKQIRLDWHMNYADETNTLTQNNADAILVSFVNWACLPLDLEFYTSDLVEG